MPKEARACVLLQQLVSKLDSKNAELDNLAVDVDSDGEFAEVVVLLVDVEVLGEEFERFLLHGTPTTSIRLVPLG